jgi:hypothetical protein
VTETQRVQAPRLPLGGRGEIAAILLVALVSALILKPWATPAAAPQTGPNPFSTPPPRPAPTFVQPGYPYEQDIFGPFEPGSEWSIWPAGFFITVQYVTRTANETPGANEPAAPTGEPRPTEGASGQRGWPSVVTIGPGDHLLWLGLDTPREWRVFDVAVWLVGAGGGRSAVPAARLPSVWGPNFTVLGLPVSPGSDRLKVWPAGSYEVVVLLDPGPVRKTFRLEILTTPPRSSTGPSRPPQP